MYDALLFSLQHYRTVCDAVWPTGDLMMWGFLFMSDWARGYTENTEFYNMMTQVGPAYQTMAQCMIENAAK